MSKWLEEVHWDANYTLGHYARTSEILEKGVSERVDEVDEELDWTASAEIRLFGSTKEDVELIPFVAGK